MGDSFHRSNGWDDFALHRWEGEGGCLGPARPQSAVHPKSPPRKSKRPMLAEIQRNPAAPVDNKERHHAAHWPGTNWRRGNRPIGNWISAT